MASCTLGQDSQEALTSAGGHDPSHCTAFPHSYPWPCPAHGYLPQLWTDPRKGSVKFVGKRLAAPRHRAQVLVTVPARMSNMLFGCASPTRPLESANRAAVGSATGPVGGAAFCLTAAMVKASVVSDRIGLGRAVSDGTEPSGHVRQHGVTPQRHPDHQLAATSSPLTSSTASPSITSSLALASDSALM